MRTKIVATVGPSSRDKETLAKLVQAGVRVLRLNCSHGDIASFKEVIAAVREIEVETHIPITLMMDLAGPKIRIGNVNNDVPVDVKEGMKFALGLPASQGKAPKDLIFIPFDHETIYNHLENGDVLIIGDGGMRLKVTELTKDGYCIVEAMVEGMLASRKGLTVPSKSLPVPALTDKDRKNLRDGIAAGLDAVAISFVQCPEDVIETKKIIKECGADIPVISKLERRNAVNRLDEILKVTDVVMVARGDLGIECPLSEVPAIQKRIIRACNAANKPVIVATQMLMSMVNNPVPTRAEATDVANAVWDGTDCVMMSEETAAGKFPVEAAMAMHEIAEHAENVMMDRKVRVPAPDATPLEFLAYSACVLAEKTNAKGIVIYATGGTFARILSNFKPTAKIYVISEDSKIVHRLNYTWGVHARQVTAQPGETHLAAIQRYIQGSHHFKTGDVTVIASSGEQGSARYMKTDTLRVYCK